MRNDGPSLALLDGARRSRADGEQHAADAPRAQRMHARRVRSRFAAARTAALPPEERGVAVAG